MKLKTFLLKTRIILLFPDLFFFEPEMLIHLSQNEISIEGNDADSIWNEINTTEIKKANRRQPISVNPLPFKKGRVHCCCGKVETAYFKRGLL